MIRLVLMGSGLMLGQFALIGVLMRPSLGNFGVLGEHELSLGYAFEWHLSVGLNGRPSRNRTRTRHLSSAKEA